MPELGPHAIFIIAAYVGVFAVTAALVGFVVISGRARRRRLNALEAQRNKERPR